MQTYSPYRVRSVKPEFLAKLEQPIAESTKGWMVRKRDGSVVIFDIRKIKAALLRCFTNVVNEQHIAMPDIEPILEYVVLGLMTRNTGGPIDVEEIQRTIIAQLWITSLSECAEHYQNYREERRKARLNRPVPTAYASSVSEDRTHFQTDLQYYQFIGKFSRWNDIEKRRETWKETVFNRVIPWFQNLPKVKNKLTQEEWDMLSKSMYELEASPAMRVVQMAGPALDRCSVGVYNCLARDTAFVTRDGVKTFFDFNDGDAVQVKTHTGAWKDAVVRCYGQDTVYPIVFGRGKSRHTVHATANHRWIQRDGTATSGIRAGELLYKAPMGAANWSYDAAEPFEKLAWCYGYVYGDGTRIKKDGEYRYSAARLCGADAAKFAYRFEEMGFASSRPLSFGGDIMAYTGTYLKDLPAITENIEYLRAFVRGWLDADGGRQQVIGNVNEFTTIQVTGQKGIDFVRRVFPVVGVYLTREDDLTDQVTNFGPRSDVTIRFGLLINAGDNHTAHFRAMSVGTEGRVVDVWCLEVEEDQSFVLSNGIVTGNCAYAPIADLRSFAELLYVLMQGTGMGFSVEYDQISALPRIAKQTGELPISVVVEDSTEGWCDALFHCLEFLFQGRDFILDTSAVRPKGTRLKTKGGRASGPEPFHELMIFIRRIVLSRQTRHLTDIDVHDICCMIGNIVQVGGVRRAALISLSDLGSHEMRSAKSGQWYIDNKHRSMANNSAVYHSKPTADVFMDEWLALIRSYSGERGICNRQAMDMQAPNRRQKGHDWGFNPCFHPDTRISTDKGMQRIGDMFLDGKSNRVVVDIRPDADDAIGLRHGVEAKPATQVELTQRAANIYRLTTGHGYTVDCTDNHEFPTPKGRKKLKDLRPGDTLLLQSNEGLFGTNGDYGDGLILGWLTGDGTTHGNQAWIELYGDDTDHCPELGAVINRVVMAQEAANGRDYVDVTWLNQISTVERVRMGGVRLGKWLLRTVGLDQIADIKVRVPEYVWQGSRTAVAGYLHGLFASDGLVNVGGHGTKQTVSLRLNQSNKRLLQDVQQLLLNFGVVSRISLRRAAQDRMLPDGKGGLKEYHCTDNYELIVNRPNAILFMERIGLSGTKRETLERAIEARGTACRKPERYTTKVVSTEHVGISDVFCLNQPETHTVIANGVVSAQCGEIQLRPYEFCNLSIAVARPEDTETTLMKKVLIATYFGTMQATCTRFNYIRDQWRKNCEEEALLGVDITGHADCPLLQPSHPSRPELLRKLKTIVNETNEALTRRFGIARSAADTCIKPGGDSSVFFDCASGVSPRFADRQIRWVRESKHSPVAKFLIDQGVPYHDSPERPNDLYVFGFPKTAPEGCLTRNSMTAVEQLENWLCWKRNWAEHSVSATIYVEPSEWFQVGSWVYDHFDEITGLSFLPKDNGVYKHAPNEELTKEQYEMFSKDFPEVDWSKLCQYEDDDQTESAQNYACVGGSCEI